MTNIKDAITSRVPDLREFWQLNWSFDAPNFCSRYGHLNFRIYEYKHNEIYNFSPQYVVMAMLRIFQGDFT